MPTSAKDEDKIVKETIRRIDQGWDQLHSQSSTSSKKDVIFVVGGTGAGKSTVTQTVTGDLRKLQSVPGKLGVGLVIVDDIEEGSGQTEARIGDPQVASKTFLPEYLSCDDDNNLVFVDCPGFNDNRGPQMDIASMVLIKKISEQVDHARFLFVIPSSSLSYSNVNKNDFSVLCTHATSFMKNLDKVKNSMGLIVTKVDNWDPCSGEEIIDQVVMNEKSTFINEVSRQESTSIKNRLFIEHLLEDKSKWALIHYPRSRGPLDGMDHFVQVRQKIRDICKTKLISAQVTSDDFAITLSAESKCIILTKLIPHMKGEIDQKVNGLMRKMEKKFVSKFESEIQKQYDTTFIANVTNLKKICKKLKKLEQRESTDVMLQVTNKVTKVAKWLQVMLPEVKMTEMKKMEEKLYLFQQITEETDLENGTSVKITNAFHSLKTKLENLLKSTLKMMKDEIVPNADAQLKNVTRKLIKKFNENYKSAFWKSLEAGDADGRKTLKKLTADWRKVEQLENEEHAGNEKLSATLKSIGTELSTPIDRNSLKKLVELEKELETLLTLTEQLNGSSTRINIHSEIRTALNKLRAEAQEKVREDFIKSVHDKIQKKTDSQFEHLEITFFEDKFYSGLSMKCMESKRRNLTSAHSKLQNLWGNFNGILDGMEKAFKIFKEEVPESVETILGDCETLLDFYDEFLENSVPRPVQDWMGGLRSFQKRIHKMNKLYEFLELVKRKNPNTIDGNLSTVDGNTSRILKGLGATSDIELAV